jgi:hypothetical protein
VPLGTSRYDEARLQGRLWTPAQRRGLDLGGWYDAADLSTLSIATGVSQWNDKSGNGNHVVQATASAQPTLALNAINGLPTLRFVTANTQMLEKLSVTGMGSRAGGISMIIVAKVDSTAVAQGLVDISDGTGTNRTVLFLIETSAARYRMANDTATPFTDTTAYHIFGGTGLTTAGNTVWADGISATITSPFPDETSVNLRIGTLYGNFYPVSGNIAEVLIFRSSLADIDRNRVEGYAAWKWGLVRTLPASHPYKNRPPLI